MKQKFILIVSLVAGLLAAILSKAWIDSRNAEIQREIDRVYAKAERIEVVAAGRPLPSGTTIQQSDLGFVSILASSVSDDTILKSDYLRIVGRKLVRSLDTRNPVLWSYIDGGKQAFRGLSDEIQQKMRAVSIPVSGASGVSGMVRPNVCVDVLGSFALAAQNAAAAAESLGLGMVYIGGMRNHPEEVAALLELPPEVFAVFGMCVGTPDPAHPAEVKPRPPQTVVLHHERYRQDVQDVGIEAYNQAMAHFYDE